MSVKLGCHPGWPRLICYKVTALEKKMISTPSCIPELLSSKHLHQQIIVCAGKQQADGHHAGVLISAVL